MACTESSVADPLYPRVTFGALPDDVLLETFELYLGKDYPEYIIRQNYDAWQTLVHVCHRWRCIVFASPRRLDLKLYCTPQRSINSETLNNWPALPIVIDANDIQSKEDVTNIIAGLGQHNRVCKIDYFAGHFQDSFLKEVAKIDKPFPALTSLSLFSEQQNVPVLPDSLLGGSAPRLRYLYLEGIPYPSIGKLLLSTTNLVSLSLRSIPHSGYIPPETIVPCLSTLSRLKSLELGFQYDQSRAHRASRRPPPLTRVVFPNLTSLYFQGDTEYLEDILSQIETPMFNQSSFSFFNRLVFDTPLLGHFIRRTEIFMTIHTACVTFNSWGVAVTLLGQEEKDNGGEVLGLCISCQPLDWQLSAVAQVLNSLLSSLPTLEGLEIGVSQEYLQRGRKVSCEDLQGEIEVTQWREFLRSFTSVKKMTLETENAVSIVVPALQELAEERATEVLPALQELTLWTNGWRPSEPVKEAIDRFIGARQLYGRPVTVYID
jgi:hypothetical protein